MYQTLVGVSELNVAGGHEYIVRTRSAGTECADQRRDQSEQPECLGDPHAGRPAVQKMRFRRDSSLP